MFDPDIIRTLDIKAANMDQEIADRNVWEFDLSLWTLLCTLAKERADYAAAQFSIGQPTVSKLSQASPEQLKALASGVLCSFRLETSEKSVITQLNMSYDPVVFINYAVNEFDAAYWLLLNRVASRDTEMAKQIFGVSRELSALVSTATDSQLRHISGTMMTHFTLRFAPNIIAEILDERLENATFPILKKHQQSLRGPGRFK